MRLAGCTNAVRTCHRWQWLTWLPRNLVNLREDLGGGLRWPAWLLSTNCLTDVNWLPLLSRPSVAGRRASRVTRRFVPSPGNGLSW
jgi:hypothetical protein